MIISASYKTDIPAFYGEWFVERLNAGYCTVLNPNARRVSRVSLDPSDVDGFVFWTKNLGPFLRCLPPVARMGRPFFVQYTINDYPRALESDVTPLTHAIRHVKEVVGDYGVGTVVWRYDTIVMSSLTPADFHLRTFARIARSLEGLADEVVVSFMHIYRKTRQNLVEAARECGFKWTLPSASQRSELLAQLVDIGKRHGVMLSVCSQPEGFVPGAHVARCMDARRLSKLAGEPIRARLRGNRSGCGCYVARDVGEYDTCPQGCVYCYAVHDQTLAKRRFKLHDPDSESLSPPPPESQPATPP